jgi:hypothetical protein
MTKLAFGLGWLDLYEILPEWVFHSWTTSVEKLTLLKKSEIQPS